MPPSIHGEMKIPSQADIVPSLTYQAHPFRPTSGIEPTSSSLTYSSTSERIPGNTCKKPKSYIGAPYFNAQEARAIRNAKINGRTVIQFLEAGLEERLRRRDAKRVSSGDYRVCAAHDIAPILGEALGIDVKHLAKDKAFRKLLDTNGLCLGTHWKGLSAKSFAPKNRKRR